MNSRTLIQSYVRGRYFVSTAYRKSSAMVDPPPWYFETIAWEWDRETKETGELIECKDVGFCDDTAFAGHAQVCRDLAAQVDEGRPLHDYRDEFLAEDEEAWK